MLIHYYLTKAMNLKFWEEFMTYIFFEMLACMERPARTKLIIIQIRYVFLCMMPINIDFLNLSLVRHNLQFSLHDVYNFLPPKMFCQYL